jgi:hypothetical protein
MEEKKTTYWDTWYSRPENRERKKQYAKERYYKNRDDILNKKKDRLSNESDEQRQARLQKMRDYYYSRKSNDNQDR